MSAGPVFKPGQVIFFRQAKMNSHRKTPLAQFQGHGFGVFLGHVPPFAPDPRPENLLTIMATAGFTAFDDIGDLLGDEVLEVYIERLRKKYNPEPSPEEAALMAAEAVEKAMLERNADGRTEGKPVAAPGRYDEAGGDPQAPG
jgi:hypothetical protein